MSTDEVSNAPNNSPPLKYSCSSIGIQCSPPPVYENIMHHENLMDSICCSTAAANQPIKDCNEERKVIDLTINIYDVDKTNARSKKYVLILIYKNKIRTPLVFFAPCTISKGP